MTLTVVILAHATDSGAESVGARLVRKFGLRAVRGEAFDVINAVLSFVWRLEGLVDD